MKMLDLTTLPSQAALWDMAGGTILSIQSLAFVLNEVCSQQGSLTWRHAAYAPPVGDWRPLLTHISQNGAWVAHFREPLNRVGHFVVVSKWTGHLLEILDPCAPGFVYEMDLDAFANTWNGETVHLAGGAS